MSYRVHDLNPAALDSLPAPCRACIFWEVPKAARGPATDRDAGREAKEAWWQATQLEWGSPGKAITVDGELAGFAMFAPGSHYPTAARLGGVSDDALLLATLWVAPKHRRAGLARTLLQAVLRETHRRGGRALEAYAVRSPSKGQSGEPCMLDEQFLLANGFTVLQDHRRTPLLRLDLRQTARWQESLSHALEGVAAVLGRREPVPARASPRG